MILLRPPALLLLLAACGDPAAPRGAKSPPPDPAPVLATTLPLATFAGRLLGGDPPVRWVVPAGASADTWRPDRESLGDLQRAALVLTSGAGLEPWLDTVSLPATRVVDASADLAGELIPRADLAHTHGLAGERSRPPADPYVWLDLELAARQVDALSAAFARRWPARAAEFAARARALTDELGELDARLWDLGEGDDAPHLFGAAPVYAYLGRRSGWTVRVVALDPERLPTSDARAGLEAGLAAGAKPLLLWPREPAAVTEEALRESTGVRSIVVSPGLELSNEERARGVDFLDLLEAGVATLEEAFGR